MVPYHGKKFKMEAVLEQNDAELVEELDELFKLTYKLEAELEVVVSNKR